jgi:hypothetical protein
VRKATIVTDPQAVTSEVDTMRAGADLAETTAALVASPHSTAVAPRNSARVVFSGSTSTKRGKDLICARR